LLNEPRYHSRAVKPPEARFEMPTYEYTCKSCGENIEVFQPFSAKPLKKHAGCGGDLQKVFHARGVVFKGSGWYAKDSRDGGAKKSSDDSPDAKPAKPKEKAKAKAESSTPAAKEPSD
jgi:putative FmdB family regulatory protein